MNESSKQFIYRMVSMLNEVNGKVSTLDIVNMLDLQLSIREKSLVTGFSKDILKDVDAAMYRELPTYSKYKIKEIVTKHLDRYEP